MMAHACEPPMRKLLILRAFNWMIANYCERRRTLKWCPWGESNPHSLRNTILSRARLPVPPHGLAAPSISASADNCRAKENHNPDAPAPRRTCIRLKIGKLLGLWRRATWRRGEG